MSAAFWERVAHQLALLPENLSAHVLLSLSALVSGIAVSVPLGIYALRAPRLRGLALGTASALQTVPSLALLALMVPVLALLLPRGEARLAIGFLPAYLALTLYALLPILRNTVTGLAGVDPDVREAAVGVGMTSRQMLLRVELPLAAPVIVAGIRTATAWVVGTATLATPVGARSLGDYIFSGLQTQNHVAVVFGCVAAAALALTLDQCIHALERAAAEGRRRLALGAGAALVLLLGASLASPLVDALQRGDRPRLVLGAKPFTEQLVLAEAMARRLEDAGFEVEIRDSLGSTILYDALAAGSIDAYVDYTGTLWTAVLGRKESAGAEEVLAGVTAFLAERDGVEVAGALGFENTYALALPRARAEELRVTSIGELVPLAPRLRVGGDYEIFQRPEWRRLRSLYDVDFAEERAMQSSLMYQAARTGAVDVVSAYSTDGRIAAYDLVVLEDDRDAFPPYDAVVLLSPAASGDPRVREALEPLLGAVDARRMREANRRVDLDGQSPRRAARALLEATGAAP